MFADRSHPYVLVTVNVAASAELDATFYMLAGSAPGTALALVAHKPRRETVPHIVGDHWYLVPGKLSNGLLDVRDGIIEQVGLVDRGLSVTSSRQRRLKADFSTD